MNANNMCGKYIKQIHDELEKRANALLGAQNLTLAQMHVLMELDAAPERQLSLKQLEGVLHVAPPTAAGIVRRLEQKGYVACAADANDRRAKQVRITAEGLDCCKGAQLHVEDMEDHLLAGLTEAERVLFQSLLKKVCEE